MPLAIKINVALREQNCQKIGSERVKNEKFVSDCEDPPEVPVIGCTPVVSFCCKGLY